MGLDMYLYRRTYVQRWDHHPDDEKWSVTVTRGGQPTHVDSEKICYVLEQVGYWRKANAIHAWFVDHVQNGIDDCGGYRVTREELEELLETINTVLASIETTPCPVEVGIVYDSAGNHSVCEDGEIIVNTEICEKLLPSCSGFFFGSTEYSNFYVDDLKYTKELLENLLSVDYGDASVSFSYQASW